MTAQEVINKLSLVPEDTPVVIMGAIGTMLFVTGAERDYVIFEESVKSFEDSHQVDLSTDPNYAQVLIK